LVSGSARRHAHAAIRPDDLAVEIAIGKDMLHQRRVFVRAAQAGGESLAACI